MSEKQPRPFVVMLLLLRYSSWISDGDFEVAIA